jgi:hypothetical protein
MGFIEHPTDLIAVAVVLLAVALYLDPMLLLKLLGAPFMALYNQTKKQFEQATRQYGTRAPLLPEKKTIVVDGNEYTAQLSPEGRKDNERGVWSVPWLPGASYRL